MTRAATAIPVQGMQTFGMIAPPSTHWRDADCAEANCGAYRNGWVSVVDETSQVGRRQAHYIRKLSGRHSIESKHPTGGTVFKFPAGQRCFTTHKVRVPRPELFVVRGGDHRGNPTKEIRRHANGVDWVEDMSEQLDRLKTIKEKG